MATQALSTNRHLRKSWERKVISPTFSFSPLDLLMRISPIKEANRFCTGETVDILHLREDGHGVNKSYAGNGQEQLCTAAIAVAFEQLLDLEGNIFKQFFLGFGFTHKDIQSLATRLFLHGELTEPIQKTVRPVFAGGLDLFRILDPVEIKERLDSQLESNQITNQSSAETNQGSVVQGAFRWRVDGRQRSMAKGIGYFPTITTVFLMETVFLGTGNICRIGNDVVDAKISKAIMRP